MTPIQLSRRKSPRKKIGGGSATCGGGDGDEPPSPPQRAVLGRAWSAGSTSSTTSAGEELLGGGSSVCGSTAMSGRRRRCTSAASGSSSFDDENDQLHRPPAARTRSSSFTGRRGPNLPIVKKNAAGAGTCASSTKGRAAVASAFALLFLGCCLALSASRFAASIAGTVAGAGSTSRRDDVISRPTYPGGDTTGGSIRRVADGGGGGADPTATSETANAADHVEAMVAHFQEAVASKVDVQTGSWFRHQPGVPRAEVARVAAQAGAGGAQAAAKPAAALAATPSDASQTSWWSGIGGSGGGGSGTSASTGDEEDERGDAAMKRVLDIEGEETAMVWDDENDVPGYFDRLTEGCSLHPQAYARRATKKKGGKKLKNFDDECFGFMQDLIRRPRCTMRLDSRTVCRGTGGGGNNNNNNATAAGAGDNNATESGSSPAAVEVPIESILGPDHLASDTVNVVVIGAGPVGLYLANALAYMQTKRSYQERIARGEVPAGIRIVVFEKRVVRAGHKKPYARDWITGIGHFLDGFEGVVDPKFPRLLDALFKSTNTALPLNAWETLLLLSNRHLGVKFVYDDVDNYKSHLREVPNLLVFDASGHRLSALNRGDIHDVGGDDRQLGQEGAAGRAEVSVSKWKASTPEMHRVVYAYWKNAWDILERAGTPLMVASRKSPTEGSILYPVLDNGNAYDVHMVKVLNLPYDDRFEEQIKSIRDKANRDRHWWTGPHFRWVTDGFFRDPVASRLRSRYPGFSTQTHFMILTPEQGVALEAVVKKYSVRGESEIPLSRVPVHEFQDVPVWDENYVGEVFLLAMTSHLMNLGDWGDGPRISAFRMRPYMYDDPLVPGGYDLGDGRRAPLLRIGDSLFTGDPNCGSGLEMHMQSVRFFQCRLMNQTRADHRNCEIYPAWKGNWEAS